MKAQYKNTIIYSTECLAYWLDWTGFEPASHTLTLANKEVYDYLKTYDFIHYWRKEDGATIILLDGSTID